MGGRLRALLAVVAVLGGCTQATVPPPPTPSPTPTVEPTPRFDPASFQYQIQQQGRIRVGVSEAAGAFSRREGQTFRGFDPDMARELAKGIFGRPAEQDPDRFIEWVPVVAATRVSVLTDDKADVVVATLDASAEAKQRLDLSDPYLVSGDRVIVMKQSDTKQLDDLGGTTVCTMRGSDNESSVVARIPGVRLLSIDSWEACVNALTHGQADAVSAPETVLVQLRTPEMRFLPGFLADDPLVVGVNRGRAGMISFVNSVLVRAISNGRWAEIYKQDLTPFTGEIRKHPHDAGQPAS